MNGQFEIRNPPFKLRVCIVAFVLSVCGGLGGLMVALFLGYATICTVMGAVAGAVAGAMLEAY